MEKSTEKLHNISPTRARRLSKEVSLDQSNSETERASAKTVGESTSDNLDLLDSDLQHADTIIKVRPADIKGRKKYTESEDLAIITYLVSCKRYDEIRAKRLWMDMELIGITTHTWESMKSRFLKNILPSIDQYEISNSWKSLLSGDTNKAYGEAEGGPTGKARQPLLFTTAQNVRKSPRPRKTTANKNFGLFGDRPPVKKAKSVQKERKSEPSDSLQQSSSRNTENISPPTTPNSVISLTSTPIKNSETRKSSTPKQSGGVDSEEEVEEDREEPTKISNVNSNKNDIEVDLATSTDTASSSSDSEDDFDKNLYKMIETDNTENKSPNNLVDGKTITLKNNKRGQSNSHNKLVGLICDSSESQLEDEEGDETSSTLDDLYDVIKTFKQKYGLSKSETLSCLWSCNGSVRDAIHWLEFDVDMDWLPVWTTQDDNLLTSSKEEHLQYLMNKYTVKGVCKRNAFLEGIGKD